MPVETTLLQRIALIAEIVIPITIICAIVGLYYNKKQIQFNTMSKCVDAYRKIVRRQQRRKCRKKQSMINALDHLGLVNEELFYIQEKYLPNDAAFRWLKNIIYFVPIYSTYGELANKLLLKNAVELKDIYPKHKKEYLASASKFSYIKTYLNIRKSESPISGRQKDIENVAFEILENMGRKRLVRTLKLKRALRHRR